MKDLTYASMEVQYVGGGCTVLRKTLPDGTVLVVNNGVGGHDMTATDLGSAIIYASEGAWQSQDDCPPVKEWHAHVLELLRLINGYLRETFPSLTEAVVSLDDATALKLRRLHATQLICVDMLDLDEDGTVIDTTPSLLFFDLPTAKRLADALTSLTLP